MAIDANSETAASVWELRQCLSICVSECCVYMLCIRDSVPAYMLVSKQDVWLPAQTPAGAAVIHFPHALEGVSSH